MKPRCSHSNCNTTYSSSERSDALARVAISSANNQFVLIPVPRWGLLVLAIEFHMHEKQLLAQCAHMCHLARQAPPLRRAEKRRIVENNGGRNYAGPVSCKAESKR